MKLITIVRTRNEERNIENLCKSYQWVNKILIADGGSTDKTLEIAAKFPNVEIRHFEERITKDGGKTWRNPEGKHINFLIDWAESYSADWIIFSDADSFPTKHSQENLREVFSSVSEDVVLVNQIFMYGEDRYFHEITLPTGKWETSGNLYAWKPGTLRFREIDGWNVDVDWMKPHTEKYLPTPFGYMHDFYPTGGLRQEKVKFYRQSGQQPSCNDPYAVYKDIRPLEEWMKW